MSPGATCWSGTGIKYSLVGYPPFGFFSNEIMTVGAKHAPNADLLGIQPGGNQHPTTSYHQSETIETTTARVSPDWRLVRRMGDNPLSSRRSR